MKEHKAPDKITQKMTRAGAVAENLTTGETEPISTRPADKNISEQPVNTAGKVLDRADAIHTRRSSKKAARKANKAVSDGMEAAKWPSSRLQFTEEERSTPDLQKAIRKSDKAADKLDAAREALP
ncbi:peptidase M23, partial [Oscillospiraceae bacterium OttesenSCG-928-F05]|nr:peptidase M23 [Oscillospiraceae bacterium OttesenSCG-928-F05]